MPGTSATFIDESSLAPGQTPEQLALDLLGEPIWSDEAYLTFSEAFNRPIELSDGRLVFLPMPSLSRQRILRAFVGQAQTWLTSSQRGELLFAPHPIQLWPGKFREPDAMIWSNENKARMHERASDAPDLVLEIVSAGHEQHDLDTKLGEYARAGIPEYWIVHPAHRTVSVYSLQNGAYVLAAHYGADQVATSRVFAGLNIHVNEILKSIQL